MTTPKTAKANDKDKPNATKPKSERTRVYFPREATAKDMVDAIREIILKKLPEEQRAAQIEVWKNLDAEDPKDE